MRRLIIILLVVLSAVSLASFASADDEDGSDGGNKFFIGLWEGVDVNDGSRRTISISDNDGDGVFELTQYDTFWTLCGDDRALAEGIGSVENGVLAWSGTLTCFTTGTVVPFDVNYEAVKESGILIEIPQPPLPLVPDVLHRVSTGK